MKKRIGQFFLIIAGLFIGLLLYAYLSPAINHDISCGIEGGKITAMSNLGMNSLDSTEIYIDSSTLTAPENQLVIAGAGGAEHYFRVEVADTAEEMTKGLMHRYRMDENSGMLFVFPAVQQATFWMRDTYIPLDILFLDENGIVVDMHKNATPRSTDYIKSSVHVKAALELNAGMIEKLAISTNTRIYHPIF